MQHVENSESDQLFFLLTLAVTDLMCMSSVNLEPIKSPQMFLRVEQYWKTL